MTTGMAACYKPKTNKPSVCFPGSRNVPFSYTDFNNPLNYITGEVVLINGVNGFHYPPSGPPIYDVVTTIDVTF